jgi:prepilin-type N-terminal cleavage/methylation domain-containing protein
MKRGGLSARAGFTLAEVLASLALVGVILPTAMAGVALAMGLSNAARHGTEAATLAAGKLAELTATGEWQAGQTEGDFGDERPGYRWEMDVAGWEEAECSLVTLTVLWTERGHERSLALSTLTYAASE